jgi:nicotinamidase-related amidase
MIDFRNLRMLRKGYRFNESVALAKSLNRPLTWVLPPGKTTMPNTRTALLLMDFQSSIADQARTNGTVEAALAARDAARRLGHRIIFCKVGFREGYPEVSETTPVFSQAMQYGRLMGRGSVLLKEFDPSPNEPVVDKTRFSAFTGSGLDVILRAHDIRHLVLSGVSTSGVVLSTLRQAFDLDYELTVLSDACMDPDHEVHSTLINKIFPRQAQVLSVAEWSASSK